MNQPKMTPKEAIHFGTFSAANASRVASVLDCGCIPYKDVFTLKRWNALGYKVQKFQHGVSIPVVGTQAIEDETGQIIYRKRPRMAAVFCKHQVEKRPVYTTNTYPVNRINPDQPIQIKRIS
jgi:hypothetical protein